ncbi:hypothetical protein [Butyrivibrio sp. WCD3002]|nr:hypothetical protein [Butyrivibrio sp. WCD3002]
MKKKEIIRSAFFSEHSDEGYPIYKKVGFEDRTQKYIDMRLKL